MNENLDQIIAELERATNRVEEVDPVDFERFFAAMNSRSEAAVRLNEIAAGYRGEISPDLADRLTAVYRRGVKQTRRLQIERAGLRAKFEKLTQNDQLLKLLAKAGPQSAWIDCRG